MPFSEIIRIHDIAILQQGLFFEFKSILKKKNLLVIRLHLTLSFIQIILIVKSTTKPRTLAELETKIICCANNLLIKLDKNFAHLEYTFQQVGYLYENFQNNKKSSFTYRQLRFNHEKNGFSYNPNQKPSMTKILKRWL